ncbi:hypothetical protein MmTuc01_2119 [Methanosarcina mazei Tuc01]|uniref:Uncharacterized protein n=1 Tax=Methanosarcina mazei Tuc01 TaxID=1236903 RepID=M1PAE1_METMZ|nr:hypothetical protein MmTuc01_2119 [Methanosarcina mazei Tuc01]
MLIRDCGKNWHTCIRISILSPFIFYFIHHELHRNLIFQSGKFLTFEKYGIDLIISIG